jgi:hypothetical protein
MRRRERRPFEVFSLSFLDVVCCGFGAIILLFVLNKMGEPAALERAQQDLSGLLARLEEELAVIRGETTVLNRELRGREEQVSEERVKVARLQGDPPACRDATRRARSSRPSRTSSPGACWPRSRSSPRR